MTRKHIRQFLFVTLLIAIIPFQAAAADSGDGWTAVAQGIDYQKFTLNDPNNVYVARMARNNDSTILESSIGSGALASGRETVSGMASRYDDALNTWGGTWGQRDRVVVAINGDYFNPGTGYPQNGMVHSGWYDKRYNDYEGWSGFVYGANRDVFIGECVATNPARQTITFANPDAQPQEINELNAPREAGHLALYTPDYASTTLTSGDGVEVIVSLTQPVIVMPSPNKVMGKVIDIRDHSGATPIAFDQVVLSATGGARDTLLANIHVGDEIGISQEINSMDKDCLPTSGKDWTNSYAAIGGAFTFLKDGEPQHLDVIGATALNPRTAIAYNDDYIFFIVVDGRQPGESIGMSLDQLAVFARDALGAKWAIAQDGGGSSTMVIQGNTVNAPSDKCLNIYLPTISHSSYKPAGNPAPARISDSPSPSNTTAPCERPVANGMMMVELLPQMNSMAFTPGDAPITLFDTELRLGPGTNYSSLLTIPAHDPVTIQAHGDGLDGILAKNTYWWYASYNGHSGWVPEANLIQPADLSRIYTLPWLVP
jgi:hypothetical protein